MGESGVVVVGLILGKKWRYLGWAFECLGLLYEYFFLGNGSRGYLKIKKVMGSNDSAVTKKNCRDNTTF